MSGVCIVSKTLVLRSECAIKRYRWQQKITRAQATAKQTDHVSGPLIVKANEGDKTKCIVYKITMFIVFVFNGLLQ